MLASPTNKPNLVVLVDGISKPEFKLWHESLKAVVADENSVLIKTADLSESDSEFLSKAIPNKKIIPAEEISSLDKPPKAFLFTNTANCISIPDGLHPEIRKACLLGGLGSPCYSHQLAKSLELNFDLFFSDVLPEEIHHHLNPEQNSYFEKHSLFLHPNSDIDSATPISSDKKVLFVYSEEESDSTLSERIFRKALVELNKARVVNLANIPVEEWLVHCLPDKDCTVLIADFNSPSLQHYLSQLCESRNINYHSLRTKAITSPVRTYLTNNFTLSDWLEQIAPIIASSLRQTFNKIITSPKGRDKKVVQNSSGGMVSCSVIRGYLMEERCSDESGQRLENIRSFYQERNSFSDNSVGNAHYLNSPIQYLLRNEPHAHLIETALEFHSRFTHIKSSLQCLIQIMECVLRLTTKLVHDQGVYHAIYRLLILSPEALLTSFRNVYLSAKTEKSYQELAGVLLALIQNRFIETKIRDSFLNDFQFMNFAPDLATRIFLACGRLDLFHKALKNGRVNSQKGLVGAAVYQKILQAQNPDQKELRTLLGFCEEEISKNLDDLRTQRSFAFLKILLNFDENVAHFLVKPSKNHNDFRRFPTSWHELSLFSLSQGRKKEANDLFLSPFYVNGGNSAHGRIGALAIAILLNDYERANIYASEFPEELLGALWLPDAFGYTTALYHAIIFKFCGIEKGVRKSVWVMNKDKHSQDIRFNKLLEEVSQKEDIQKPLKELADSLFEGMKFLRN